MDSFFIDKFNFINAKYRKILTVQCSGGGAIQNTAFFLAESRAELFGRLHILLYE